MCGKKEENVVRREESKKKECTAILADEKNA